jgi:ATP-binding protein involved in chromosome partitioning
MECMMTTPDEILAALTRIKGPDMSGNIVDLGLVSEVLVRDGRAYFSITVPPARAEELEPLRLAAEKVVKELPGITGVVAVLTAETNAKARAAAPQRAESARVQAARQSGTQGAPPLPPSATAPPRMAAPAAGARTGAVPGIRHMIAVASGKGGVGKSTTAVNLALAFQANGLKAGILDADIYGPSQPRLLGLAGRPDTGGGQKLQPMIGHGLKAMSMGFLVEEATPIIWRGPMVVSALTQMLRDVSWGDLDVLVIDMPPGTGDVQLTMAQQVPLSGAIIVSTPQDLALIDARKGLNMFKKTDVPVLGIIENMSYFLCPSCGTRSDIFGHGGAQAEAKTLAIPFLGEVPLHMAIRETSDAGRPVVVSDPIGVHAGIYRAIAQRAWAAIDPAQAQVAKAPKLDVTDGGAALRVAFEGQAPFALSAEMLRVMSPSAEVQGHSPEQRVTVAKKRHVKISRLDAIGTYATKIVFDDGHDTGLFTWPYLATLGRERERRWTEYLAELEAKGLSRS